MIRRQDSLSKRIKEFRNSIGIAEDVERAAVFNQDGGVFLSDRTGSHNAVAFSHDELLQMRGKTLIHTHIDTGDLTDRLLSPEDIYTAAYYGMDEIQAVTPTSMSALSPGMTLKGNTSMRNRFVDGYNDILENGRREIRAFSGDEAAVREVIQAIARKMSDYLQSNTQVFGYLYEEWGVFD